MGVEEKAEVTRRVFEHLARKEPAAAVEYFDPDIKFDFTRSLVLEPHDFIELDDDGLLFSIRGRRTSRDGIELTVSGRTPRRPADA